MFVISTFSFTENQQAAQNERALGFYFESDNRNGRL